MSLAACATATPYQPLTTHGTTTGGYSELKVTNNRFRVMFTGNTLTSRETVERYLLFRAAEVTLGEGADWFEIADRHTDHQSRTYYDRDPFGYGYGMWWRPTWAYVGRGRYVRIDPWGPGPFWPNDFSTETVTKYEASAEIVIGKGPKPANDPAAFDAHEVVNNLGPSIVRPTT
ncbi:MAG TPA: hypothetical protein VFN88_03855 [Caulobacteraceae bacterium]|nr:hypothetical protein [Caulobacteraceae bacterium]